MGWATFHSSRDGVVHGGTGPDDERGVDIEGSRKWRLSKEEEALVAITPTGHADVGAPIGSQDAEECDQRRSLKGQV